jgi:hypothetical protein
MLTSTIKDIGNNAITLAVQQNLQGIGQSDQKVKDYQSLTGTINQAATFPLLFVYMYLITKFNNVNFLIFSISTTVATGTAMSFLISDAGTSPFFTVVYLISEIIDNATVLILLTMLNNCMQLESRGIINGIHLLSVQFSGMVLNLVNGYI